MNRDKSFAIFGADDLKISVRKWQGPGHDTCVLIHGLADSQFVWNSFAERLASHTSVICLDLRGHGDSDWDPQKRYRLDSYVSDIERVLDQLNLGRVFLAGHSLGGDVAAQISLHQPGRVGASVFVDSGPASSLETRTVLKDRALESCRSYHTIEEYGNWLAETRLLADSRVLTELARASLAPAPGGGYRLKFDPEVLNVFLAADDDSWWWPALERCEMPVQIIRGMGSAYLSKQVAEKMVKSLRRGQLATVKLAGHSVMNDNPVGFCEAIMGFLVPLLTSRPG